MKIWYRCGEAGWWRRNWVQPPWGQFGITYWSSKCKAIETSPVPGDYQSHSGSWGCQETLSMAWKTDFSWYAVLNPWQFVLAKVLLRIQKIDILRFRRALSLRRGKLLKSNGKLVWMGFICDGDRDLEADSGDCCTGRWMHLSLSCALKSGWNDQFYVLCILSQEK